MEMLALVVVHCLVQTVVKLGWELWVETVMADTENLATLDSKMADTENLATLGSKMADSGGQLNRECT